MTDHEIETNEVRVQAIKKITARLNRLSLTELAKVIDYLSILSPLIPMNCKNYESGKTDFLMGKKKCSEETYRAYKRAISQFEEFFKNRKAKSKENQKINPWEANWENIDFYYKRCKLKQSPSTVNQKMAALSSFFQFLSARYQISNPFNDKWDKIWIKTPAKIRYTPQKFEIDKIHQVARGEDTKNAITLAAEYGIQPRDLKDSTIKDDFLLLDGIRKIEVTEDEIKGLDYDDLCSLYKSHKKITERIRKLTKKLSNGGKIAHAYTLFDFVRYYRSKSAT